MVEEQLDMDMAYEVFTSSGDANIDVSRGLQVGPSRGGGAKYLRMNFSRYKCKYWVGQ